MKGTINNSVNWNEVENILSTLKAEDKKILSAIIQQITLNVLTVDEYSFNEQYKTLNILREMFKHLSGNVKKDIYNKFVDENIKKIHQI